jgi:glycosyltransferase involved in cell wall biosynthesis
MGTWIVFEKLFLNQPIPGFATLAAAIFLLAGIQLVAIGIVGEYVARIFEEVKQRPRYIVADEIDRSPLAKSGVVHIRETE